MTTQILGCAELYGRLRHAVNQMGAQRRTRPTADAATPYFSESSGPLDLHGHVLSRLGVPADKIRIMGVDGIDLAYPASGFTLTEKAARLARFSQEFEESWTWGDAANTAARLAHQLDDTPDDRRLGDVALLAVLGHVARQHPAEMTPLPGWLPQDTPLFINGYPTTLLGHVAADLRVNAITASHLAETNAVDLFRVLGWQLSARAEAVADTVQDHESRGASWPDAVTAAERLSLERLGRTQWDR